MPSDRSLSFVSPRSDATLIEPSRDSLRALAVQIFLENRPRHLYASWDRSKHPSFLLKPARGDASVNTNPFISIPAGPLPRCSDPLGEIGRVGAGRLDFD